MKKIYSMITMLAMLLVLSSSTCSGSSDDDDINSEYNTFSKGKRIIKWTNEVEGGGKIITSYIYDSEGRVVKMFQDKNGKNTTTTFTYGDHFITRIDNNNKKIEYVVENGLIVRETYNKNDMDYYTYENGYLSKIVSKERYVNYIWNNGNLMETDEYDNKTGKLIQSEKFEYSNHLDFGTWVITDDEPLWNYKGEEPKNLPSKEIVTDMKTGSTIQLAFEWIIEGNLPIKCIVKYADKGSTYTNIFTFEWE